MVNIIVAFPKIEVAKNIRNLLVRSGIEVTYVCTTGAQVTLAVDDLEEGIVISGYRFVDMMYSELHSYLPETFDMLLLASRQHFSEYSVSNLACLYMPVKAADLIEKVNIMVEDILHRHRRKKDGPKIRTEGEKKVIENAKYMLMQKRGMAEDEAHKYLQKCSMDNGMNLMETAHMVLGIWGQSPNQNGDSP